VTVRRALLAFVAVMAVTPATAGAATLDARIEHLIARSQFAGSRTGLAVFDRTTGRYLAIHNGRQQLRPGSNMKLATSAALFIRFGPSARLRTRIMASGPLSAGTVNGSLFLVGGGDPSLSTKPFARLVHGGGGTLLSEVAAAVRARGVRRVIGRLYGGLTRRYLSLEAEGFRRCCTAAGGAQ